MKKITLALILLHACMVLLISTQIASAFTHSLPAPHALPWVDSDHESNCSSCEVYTYDKEFWFQMFSRTYLCYVRDSFSMPEWHNVEGYIETYHGDPVDHGMWCGSDQGGYWGFGLSGATYPEITLDTPWVDTTDDMYYVDASATFNGGYGTINPGYVEQNSVIFPANWTPPPAPEFTLSFPIESYTPYSARVTSVLDHSVFARVPIKFYTKDSVIETFNGETGDRKCKNIYITTTYSIRGCKNASGTRFLNGTLNYTGGGEPRYLWYDGHPGYDYGIPKGTNLLASADGKLFKATKDLVNSPRAANSWNKFHTFYIDHGNGYSSWYLHSNRLLPEIVAEINEKGYADVTQGQPIAKSGDYGTPGQNHLHFEVRKDGFDHANIVDPYKNELWE